MPIFEYVCQECQHEFEALVFGRDKAKCPKCESDELSPQLEASSRCLPKALVARQSLPLAAVDPAEILAGREPALSVIWTKKLSTPSACDWSYLSVLEPAAYHPLYSL